MKRILVMAALMVCLLSGNAMAAQLVQLNDNYSAQETLLLLNDKMKLTISSERDLALHMVTVTPERVEDIDNAGLKDTKGWGSVSAQGTVIFLWLNGNGKICMIGIINPIATSKRENIEYAWRLLAVLDSKDRDYKTMQEICKQSVEGNKAAAYYSPMSKRVYHVNSMTDGENYCTYLMATEKE